MGILTQIWESTSVTLEGAIALGAVAAFALLVLGCTLRARRGRPFAVRSLPAAACIRAALAQAMETGEEMCVAVGTGGLGDLTTADTLAGLELSSYLARRGAVAEVPVRVWAAEPTALVGAQASLQRGATAVGYPEAYEPTRAEFVSPAPLAYGVGVAAALREEPDGREGMRRRVGANALLGRYGVEVLLPGEAGVEQGVAQTGGTSDPTVLPLFLAATDSPLLGEEIYALGAGLGRPEHTGSLAAQDVFRILLVVAVVAGAILALIGR